MATTRTGWDDEINPTFNAGAGMLMLSLAQVILIFTFWVVAWPSSFGLPDAFHVRAGVAGFFTGAAILGFYLGFLTLSKET
jgi:hypothetical protein